MKKYVRCIALICLLAPVAMAQTSFSYQGNLTDAGSPAAGSYEMRFTLFDAVENGNQIGTPQTIAPVTVANGIFTVTLDFGSSPFAGNERWLQIEVLKPPAASFTLLAPRQRVAASPYSIRTLSAGAADSISPACIGCVDDAKISDVAGSKVIGAVANATTAASVSGIVPIANGGTGSATKNFVDLTTSQVITGDKHFNGVVNFGASPPYGLLGQPISTAFSTGTISPGAAFTQIPGLSVTINVPAVCSGGLTVCTAYITAEGGVQTTATATNGVSRVDIVLQMDGVLFPAGGYKRVVAANTGGSTTAIENWAMGLTTTVGSGTRTFSVSAALQSGLEANVGGNASSVLQSRLTVFILRS